MILFLSPNKIFHLYIQYSLQRYFYSLTPVGQLLKLEMTLLAILSTEQDLRYSLKIFYQIGNIFFLNRLWLSLEYDLPKERQ